MMVRLPFILLAIATVCIALEDNTWSWIWRKAPDDPEMDRGTSIKECTNIDHKKGLLFEFDGGNAGVCLLMYGEKDCKGGYGGYGCTGYSKKASADILSYQVVPGEFYEDPSILSSTSIWSDLMETSTVAPTTSTSSSSSTETTLSTTTTTTSEPDPTSNPATTPPPEHEGDEDSGSSLSGGAIAGIVVGVIAGVAIIALIAYFLFRQRSKKSSSEPSSAPPPFEGAKPAVKAPPSYQTENPVVEDKSYLDTSAAKWGGPTSPVDEAEPDEPGPSPYRTRPPPGTAMAELSSNNQIVELDGTSQQRER